MSQQLQITGGAKVRDLQDVIIGTSGVLSSLAFNVANGVPKLDSNGKILVSQLPNSVMEYQGTWNASTNTPTLVNGVGNQGDVYLCNVAGTTNFGAGPITFAVGDSAIYSGTIWQRAGGATGTVTSVGLSTSGNAFTIGSSPVTTSGTITINGSGTSGQYINGAGNLTTFPTLLSSVGLSMPSAFSVSNSPLTANGTIAVTGAGYPSQYIRGDGTLADFPTSGGGGSSVSYYLNGGTSQGTIGGVTYYEMSKTADTGTGVDFPKSGDGLIVSFLTDAGDPAQLNIPAGNWNYEIYASMSSNGGTPQMYAELYVYNGTTFTLISTSSNEILYDGVNLNLYTFAMTVPATTLALTDRLAVKLYATNSGGKTTTVHTQDSHLCQIITTFSTGITALNGLTAQVQYFATGTSGTDFNISSSTATHTFNIPDASATARGLITTGTQTIAGAKTFSGFASFTSTSGTSLQYGAVIQKGFTPLVFGSNITNIYSDATTNNLVIRDNSSIANLVFNNSTQTYTFPASSGTIALTSSLSSYVPYTGATGPVDLGYYDLTVSGIKVGIGSGGSNNTRVGALAFGSNTTGGYNTAIGAITLVLNTTGSGNTAIGNSALYSNTTASNNTAIGGNALANNTTASNNTAVGGGSLGQNTIGTQNSALGSNSLTLNTIGSNNIAIGYTSLNANTTGSQNTSIGVAALTLHTTGTYNTAIGYGAGGSITTGSYNTIVGYYAGTATMSNNIVLADGQGNIKYRWDGTNNNLYGNVNFSSTIGNGTYTYTLPSATGTLALTSDLGSYLPLTGGTLTGGLYINPTNTATVGLDVASDTIRFRSDNLEGFKRQLEITMGSGTLVQMVAKGYGANYGTDLAFYTATTSGVNGSPAMYITSSNRIGILTGTPAYTLDVSGTGRFTGQLSVTTGASTKVLSLNGAGTGYQYAEMVSTGANLNIGIASSAGAFWGSGGGGAYYSAIGTANATDFVIGTNNAGRLIVTSAGNVGIGTSSPSKLFTVVASADGQTAGISGATYGLRFDNGGSFAFGGSTIHGVDNTLTATYQILGLNGSQVIFGTSGTERMRITSGGVVCVGTTSGFTSGLVCSDGGTSYVPFAAKVGTTANATQIFFNNPNGAVGSITTSGSATAYNTSSDYRLKQDLKNYNGLDLISAIKTYDYEWKSDNTRAYGVMAHELSEVIPYVVNGEKDALDEEGNIKAQGVDYSKLVPILVKAIQEQNQTIQSLQEQINILAK